MKYQRTTVETIEVVCVYDPERGTEQHPDVYDSDDGERYLIGPSDRIPLQKGDWIVYAYSYSMGGRNRIAYRIIPVAEQDGWERVE